MQSAFKLNPHDLIGVVFAPSGASVAYKFTFVIVGGSLLMC